MIHALESVLLLANDAGDLPDNGEYHGGAIADEVREALRMAKEETWDGSVAHL